MNGHHLIMGTMIDYIDGREVDDTHDERYRQKIARMLVDRKGYARAEITPGRKVMVRAAGKCARVPVAFTVSLEGRIGLLVHYGPGSLVTRHRPALALSRLLCPYQVPVVVVTNGEDADILDGPSGKRLGEGLDGVPSRSDLSAQLRRSPPLPVPAERAAREARIVMAFEVDDSCPCDTSICRLGPGAAGGKNSDGDKIVHEPVRIQNNLDIKRK